MSISRKVFHLNNGESKNNEDNTIKKQITISQKSTEILIADVHDPINIDIEHYYQEDRNYGGKTSLCKFYKYPTGNCQLGSLAYVNLLFQYHRNIRLKVLQELHKSTMKNMWLMDVQDELKNQVFDLLGKDNFTLIENYVSTRGTDMCILLYRTKYLLDII